MSTLAEIRAAIVAVLQAVPDVGIVHDRERYAQDTKRLAQLYAVDGAIRGWYVRRVSTQETSGAIGRWEITHQWRVRGFRSFKDEDASELAFQDVIEAMRDAVRADETLGGTVIDTVVGDGGSAVAGLQVDEVQSVMFAGVLCHAATLTLYTRHYE